MNALKDGAFAEYAVINADFVVKLPDGLDPFEAAPLYCAGVSMYKALKVSETQSNDWISIVGIGGLGKLFVLNLICFRTISFVGSLGIKYAKIMGFRVIGVVAENDQVANCSS